MTAVFVCLGGYGAMYYIMNRCPQIVKLHFSLSLDVETDLPGQLTRVEHNVMY